MGKAKPSEHPAGAQGSMAAISGFVTDDVHSKLLNDRVRLGILSSLAVVERLSFRQLKDLLSVSDGNLSTHARKLEEAGLILCDKSFDGRSPKTEYRISSDGTRTLQRYLKHMEALIKATST